MANLCLILGDQLDLNSSAIKKVDPDKDYILMAEVLAESTAVASSKQRTVLFLSAMRHFADELRSLGYKVVYYTLQSRVSSLSTALEKTIRDVSPESIFSVLPGDVKVLNELNDLSERFKQPIDWLPDSHFISLPGEFSGWLKGKQQPRMEYWYRHLRKRTGVLMDEIGKPVGGKWNFDSSNRKSFGKKGPLIQPLRHQNPMDDITAQVINDVNQFLPNLPGSIEQFNWPVTRGQALEQLNYFINNHLVLFGDYQDAMWENEPFLYHSAIASSLNVKLISPKEVISAVETAYESGIVPLNSAEGFIRQVLGWREYVRGLYWSYRNDWLEFNHLSHSRPLPEFYWNADTEMVCLKNSIQQVLHTGYGHHIQRLMVTGLFALLMEVEPKQVHEWYLAMYVDAVAWVEVPNTIGMSQFADGGILGSKPYIASGSYINRMSNYCSTCPYNPKEAKGSNACPFTSLYWRFIAKHYDWMKSHPRLGMQANFWDKRAKDEQEEILATAEKLIYSTAS